MTCFRLFVRECGTLTAAAFCALVIAGCAAKTLQRIPPPPAEETVTAQPEPEVVPVEPVFVKPSKLTALSGSAYQTIKARVDSLIPDSLFPPAHIGLKISSLKTRETLYELNANSLFNPASNQKLFTSAAALAVLDDDFLFSTVVSLDPSVSTIFIKGFGDPLFSMKDLDSLARLTAFSLPSKSSWKVVGDRSYFDTLYWGYGWNWDDEPEPYQPFISPLILNGNSIKLIASPGAAAGAPLLVRTEPPTDFVTIENRGITARETLSTPLRLTRAMRERRNVLVVEGEMLSGSREQSTELSVLEPERYVAHIFAERLRNLGTTISGVVIDTVSPQAIEIARISRPLDTLIAYINKQSDNLSAEVLLKILGAEVKGTPGSAANGAAVVKEFLDNLDIDTNSIKIADGSGLSRMNLASPAAVVRLLERMYDSPYFERLANSLSIAGIDGSTRSRMRRTAAAGNMRSKTGTLTAVSALSGYLLTADGEPLAFSMMMMNYPAESRMYRRVQDEIGVFLSRLSRTAY
ncbi:MAG: D-alanyl-D-alanine carboxypeptidase/D-alanyl-D-alanine-endopeptidase [Bacteroidetes bacterium]|nr:D-alanyl-D-alanine carboxypeptidase/D-alanyl-D-alanine-endopeptidase [Bacteroidota bacterium]MCW5894301.1 D-alanyl-D-alanine carboxypeptidase/D-alanyl-D-alanine-endopeptidase [Bacteroidota bacterium]